MKHIYFILAVLLFLSCTNDEKTEKPAVSEKTQPTKKTVVENQTSKVSKKTYKLGDIQVELTQTQSDGIEFFCISKLVTSKSKSLIDSISFTPEPVGGDYGISKPNRIENHLVFTKHGDYDGKTILINQQGKIQSIIGGKNYYDSKSQLLFTIYDSDLNGFAVFNLASDSTLLEMTDIEARPISFHKAFGERYFMLCSKNQTDEKVQSIWEIEFESERIMQVDLDSSQINESNILKTWTIENVNCECEK